MKGDFSRFTFNPKNRYSRVLMQQGRVQIDADWNEQLDISAYRTETEITDFIGQSGAPENPKDLEQKEAYTGDLNYQSTSFRITANKAEIRIGAGRYYVEGRLFENNQSMLFTEQPDYPDNSLPDPNSLPDSVGIYLAYLDVWQHHVTALEVPTLREAALGGADTTTRVKNVWQVKLQKLGKITQKDELLSKAGTYAARNWQPDWEPAISTETLGTLSAQVQAGAIVENQLYRVEIHQGNASKADENKTVTFKWSRDNGSIAAQVESKIDDNNITIKNAGRDTQLAFPVNQLVEFSNTTWTLKGEPGILATVEAVQGNRLTVKWKTNDNKPPQKLTACIPPKQPLDHIIVRRWDSSDAIAIDKPNQNHELEQSITVKFESNKRYKTGDYWLIPSRALTGTIEWSPDFQPPHGIRHRYCSLALLKLENKEFSVLADWRSIFRPITSGLVSKDGDRMTGDLTIDRNLYVAGNVGIGLVTSAAKLAVNGALQIGGAGSINAVMEFPSESYIILPPQSIPTGNQITICFWLNGDVRSSGNTSVISALDSNSKRVLNIHLPWGNKVIFDCGNVNDSYDRLEYTISPSDCRGVWSHWAFTKNSSSGKMEIYKDGKLLTSGNDKTKPLLASVLASIGGIFNTTNLSSSNATLNYPYRGLLANVRIWKRVLSSIEIQTEMRNVLSGTTDLVASYLDIKANVAKDYSSNNFDGSAHGGVTSKTLKLQDQVMFGAGSESILRHLIKSRHDGKADSGNALDFYVWNTAKTPQELGTQHTLTLNGEGYVGIGTTEPKAKLHINGGFVIEQGQLIRGVPVISFLSKSAKIDVSASSGSNTQIEFNFPNEVVQAEALLKSWDLQCENIDDNQSVQQISIKAKVLDIVQKKVTVEVTYSWAVTHTKASSGSSPNKTGLDVELVVIAAMNKAI